MASQYGKEIPPIGSVIVITGSALRSQATTCADYVMKTWPKTGSLFLELLDDILGNAKKGSGITQASWPGGVRVGAHTNLSSPTSADQKFPVGKLHLIISSERVKDSLYELAQQFAWVGSALNTSRFGDQVAYVTPVIQGEEVWEISFEQSPLRATDTPCWLPFFCGAVIASGRCCRSKEAVARLVGTRYWAEKGSR